MAEPELIERANGSCYHRVYVWNPVARKKVWCFAPDGTKRFPTWEAADAARLVAEKKIDGSYTEAGIPVQRRSRQHTVDSYAPVWHAARGGVKGTKRTRWTHLKQIAARFKGVPVDALTKAEVRAYDAEMEEAGLSLATRDARIGWLRRMYEDVRDEGLCTINPAKGVKVRVARRGRPRILEDQVLLLLLCFLPKWFWPAVLLSYDCGLRAGEVAGLRWCNVHLDGDDPHVLVQDVMDIDRTVRGMPKGKKAEKVALTSRVVAALRVLRAMRPDATENDHVFVGRLGQPLSKERPVRLLRAAWERSGLTGQRPTWHDLRHACATMLARSGASAYEIKAVLRHGSVATSQRYVDELSTVEQRKAQQMRATMFELAA